MIEVEAPDGTIVEFPEGTDDATILRVMKQAYGQPQEALTPAVRAANVAAIKARNAGLVSPDAMAQNRAGSEAMTGQSIEAMELQPNTMAGALGDLAKATGAGLSRGVNQLAGMAIGTASPAAREGIPKLADMMTGGATQYRGKTPVSKVGGTVGEFLPGAMLLGGPDVVRSALTYGAGAGTASELAGQATEGTAAEPFARIGAALAVPAMLNRVPAFAGEAGAMANQLRDAGVRGITAGQAKGSTGLMRAEGRLQPTERQLSDYTAAILKQIGSPATKATPEVLRTAEQAIVKQMDDAVAGLSVTADPSQAAGAAQVAARYIERVPAGQLTPRVKGIAQEIVKANRGNRPVTLAQLKEWRSDIGSLTVSPDAATREAAHGLRQLIDGMTDQALIAANRGPDIAKLASGREAYRNYIGIRDAASRAGAETGTLSPTQLNQSIIRSQGREAYATGRTTPMAELTRAGAAVLRPAPSVMAGGTRAVQGGTSAALASAGAAAAYGAGGGPMGILASGILGAAAPALGQAAMRSRPVQGLLANPAEFLQSGAGLSSGILAQ